VSISQSTEFGTCYTPDEIRALADHAHEHGMVLHMDGSRLSNAAAYLGASLAEITTEAGVDVLSLGGTKNGLLGAEAVLALNPAAVPGLTYLRKTNMQLGSKMRFVSAQLAALYEDGLWLRSASHANAMAARLRAGIEALIADGRGEGVTLPFATQSNVVFPTLPAETKARAHAAFHFYDWPGDATLVRLMCSFDTTEQDVDDLLAVLAVE
jgi:threonine aldolase